MNPSFDPSSRGRDRLPAGPPDPRQGGRLPLAAGRRPRVGAVGAAVGGQPARLQAAAGDAALQRQVARRPDLPGTPKVNS